MEDVFVCDEKRWFLAFLVSSCMVQGVFQKCILGSVNFYKVTGRSIFVDILRYVAVIKQKNMLFKKSAFDFMGEPMMLQKWVARSKSTWFWIYDFPSISAKSEG